MFEYRNAQGMGSEGKCHCVNLSLFRSELVTKPLLEIVLIQTAAAETQMMKKQMMMKKRMMKWIQMTNKMISMISF